MKTSTKPRYTSDDPVFKRQLEAVYGRDLDAAANGLGVSRKTIERYLRNGCNNQTVRKLLYIQFRGYLPDEKRWQSWRCSEKGLHSPDGMIYTPGALNAWNLEKTQYLFNKWFIQDLKEIGIYDELKHLVDQRHSQPVAELARDLIRRY